MGIVRLPVVQIATISPTDGTLTPVSQTSGGPIAMIVAVSGAPYRLIGFSIGLYPSYGTTGNNGIPSNWTDGRVKVPLQVTILPSYSPLARGELELLYVNTWTPPKVSNATNIVAYAKLEGVIYPGVAQVYVVFSLPNTAVFVASSTKSAALIVEEYNDRDGEH
jgi:hypothetical protein